MIGIWNNNQTKQIIWQSKDVIQETRCSRIYLQYRINKNGKLFFSSSFCILERTLIVGGFSLISCDAMFSLGYHCPCVHVYKQKKDFRMYYNCLQEVLQTQIIYKRENENYHSLNI